MKDLISIIMPAYNSENTIDESLQSILKQSYENWELFIIDDFSSDQTINKINNYLNDKRISLIQMNENVGQAMARNIGIKKSKGNYLTFLDSDDLWMYNFLEKMINFSKINNYYFCCASYKIYNKDKNIFKKPFIVPNKISYQSILKENSISCLTAFINIDVVGKIYMKNIINEDYYLWIEILKKVNIAYGIRETLAIRTLGKSTISSNKFKIIKGRWFIYRKLESLSIFYSIYYMVIYIINALKKFYL